MLEGRSGGICDGAGRAGTRASAAASAGRGTPGDGASCEGSGWFLRRRLRPGLIRAGTSLRRSGWFVRRSLAAPRREAPPLGVCLVVNGQETVGSGDEMTGTFGTGRDRDGGWLGGGCGTASGHGWPRSGRRHGGRSGGARMRRQFRTRPRARRTRDLGRPPPQRPVPRSSYAGGRGGGRRGGADDRRPARPAHVPGRGPGESGQPKGGERAGVRRLAASPPDPHSFPIYITKLYANPCEANRHTRGKPTRGATVNPSRPVRPTRHLASDHKESAGVEGGRCGRRCRHS